MSYPIYILEDELDKVKRKEVEDDYTQELLKLRKIKDLKSAIEILKKSLGKELTFNKF